MWKILESKYFSLFCAILNSFFAATAFLAGDWGWFVLCGLCTALCGYNYLKAGSKGA